MTLRRIIRALFTLIPSVGSVLEQLFFGSQDDKTIKKIKDDINKGDNAFGIIRDRNGEVINNPYDFGFYDQ
ncbi:MAG: hypothetical protein IJV36_02065 [Prevotella sp.]|nr:hypothetical protein [Prevotella sp.]